MEKDILINTRPTFNRIVKEFGKGDPEMLELLLKALLRHHQMDLRNAVLLHMSDEEIEIQNL